MAVRPETMTAQWSKRSLRRARRLTASAALGFASAILVIAAVSTNLAASSFDVEDRRHMRGTAEMVARVVDEQHLRFSEVLSSQVRPLVDLPEASGDYTADDHALVARALERIATSAGVEYAGLLDARGRVVATSPPIEGAVGLDLGDVEVVRRALTDPGTAHVLGGLTMELTDGRTAAATTLAIRDRDRNPIGVLAAISSDRAQHLTNDIRDDALMDIHILDGSAVVVASSHGAPELGAEVRETVARGVDGGTGAGGGGSLVADGMLLGWDRTEHGWTVVAARDLSDVQSGQRQMATTTWLVAVLLAAVAVATAMATYRNTQATVRLRTKEETEHLVSQLQNGLVPTVSDKPGLRVRSVYRPGESRLLLGGDFFDVIERDDGSVVVVLGDVCGHGPAEAAIGAQMRSSARTLALSSPVPVTPDALLGGLEQVLMAEQAAERLSSRIYVTALCVVVSADRSRLVLASHGHPPPILDDGSGARLVEVRNAPPLGWGDLATSPTPVQTFELASGWSLLAYTDGAVEGHVGAGPERYGDERLLDAARELFRGPDATLDGLVNAIADANGGPLDDDTALIWLSDARAADGTGPGEDPGV